MSALPTIELDPPTISMTFGVNDSPLAGRDGTHVSCVCFTFTFFTSFSCLCKKCFGVFPNPNSDLSLLSSLKLYSIVFSICSSYMLLRL